MKPINPILYNTVRKVLLGRESLSQMSKANGIPKPSPPGGDSSKRFHASFQAQSRNCQVGSSPEWRTPEASSSATRLVKSRPLCIRENRNANEDATTVAKTRVATVDTRRTFP